jgi:hypothetical protein
VVVSVATGEEAVTAAALAATVAASEEVDSAVTDAVEEEVTVVAVEALVANGESRASSTER